MISIFTHYTSLIDENSKTFAFSIEDDFTVTDNYYYYNFEFSIRMIADKYDSLEGCMVSYDNDE